jgi:hypothetical protein
MSLKISTKQILSESLESIIFEEKDFDELKRTINDLSLGKIEPKELKEIIINSRLRMLEELLQFFPFLVKQELTRQSLEKFSEYPYNPDNPDLALIEQLAEREELLIEVGQRIDGIFKQLKVNIDVKNHSDYGKARSLGFTDDVEYHKFLKELLKIDRTIGRAEETFELNRFNEFLRLKFLSIELIVELVYLKLFRRKKKIGDGLKVDDLINEIEHKLNKKIVDHKKLKYWRRLRNDVIHKDIEVKKDQAEKGKTFFNDLFDNLKKIIEMKIKLYNKD